MPALARSCQARTSYITSYPGEVNPGKKPRFLVAYPIAPSHSSTLGFAFFPRRFWAVLGGFDWPLKPQSFLPQSPRDTHCRLEYSRTPRFVQRLCSLFSARHLSGLIATILLVPGGESLLRFLFLLPFLAPRVPHTGFSLGLAALSAANHGRQS